MNKIWDYRNDFIEFFLKVTNLKYHRIFKPKK